MRVLREEQGPVVDRLSHPQALGLRRRPRSIPATMRKNVTGSPLM